jgi:hypothetical protein
LKKLDDSTVWVESGVFALSDAISRRSGISIDMSNDLDGEDALVVVVTELHNEPPVLLICLMVSMLSER